LEEMSAGDIGDVHEGEEPIYELSLALLSVTRSSVKVFNCM
jgi:hypothetical protein